MYDALCPICKNRASNLVSDLSIVQRDMLERYDQKYYDGALCELFSISDFAVSACKICNHLFYSAPPSIDALSRMYEAHAKVLENKAKRNLLASSHKINHSDKYQVLRSLYNMFPEQPKLLDYGGGNGIWSSIAVEIGFEVVCYEPYSDRVDKKIEHLSDWDDVKNKTFDVVLCNQVLEHIVNPTKTLEDIALVCTSKSLLFSAVPNAGKKSLPRLMKSWPYDGKASHILAPFQHLHGFSQASFLKMHKKVGFKPAVCEMIRGGSWGLKSVIALFFSRFSRRFSRCYFLFNLEQD